MKCGLELAESLKQAMDRDEPGWTETTFWCPPCREDHVLISDSKQFHLLAGLAAEHTPSAPRHLPPLKPGAPEGWCRWHETASPELTAPCAYCGTALHVHKDALGRVKSGREGKGFLTQRCPACHRYNAVHPPYGKGGIHTSKLEGDKPVLQMNLGRM